MWKFVGTPRRVLWLAANALMPVSRDARSTTQGVARRDANPAAVRPVEGNDYVKRITALTFLIAGALGAGASAGGTDAAPWRGRPDGLAPDTRAPQAGLVPAGSTGPTALDEGFEQFNVFGGGMFANGWIRQNNSDEADSYWWQCIRTSEGGFWNAADGPDDSCGLAGYTSTLIDGGTISNWIVTPLVSFGSGSTVSFYTRTKPGSTFPDRLQVRACSAEPCTDLGTGSEDVGDFTTLLLDIDPGEAQGVYPEDWTQYVVDFSEGLPTSGNGRIAFRYYVHDSGPNGSRGNLIGLDRVVVTTGQDAASPIDLAVTVAPADAAHPDACATSTVADVTVGDQVTYCYKVTNHSQDTLNYQYLRDDVLGSLLTQMPQTLAPGASYQYNRTVTIGESQAPSSTWTAQSGPSGYSSVTAPQPSDFIDISDGTPIADQYYPDALTFPSDFDFRLYGRPITHFCVLAQGIFESIEQSCSSNFFYGQYAGGIPADAFIGTPSILPMWVRTPDPPTGGSLFYKLVGTAPHRQFIVEWKDVPFQWFDGSFTDEIILNEGTDTIEVRYADDYGVESGSAIVGLQNQWLADVYSSNTESLDGVGSLLWTPSQGPDYTATRQVTVNAGVPALALDHDAINATAPSHGNSSASLAVSNGGDGRLDWSVQSAAAPSNMPHVKHFVAPVGDRKNVSFGRPSQAAGSASAPAATGNAPPLPFGDASHYAYAIDLAEGPYLWRFDPFNIATSGEIAAYPNPRSVLTGATFLDDDFSKLYVFDSANSTLGWLGTGFAGAVIGTAAIPADLVTGMKQDPTSGTVYLSTADGQSSGLWTIDPVTAAVQFVGGQSDAPGIIDIAFDAQGNLYGVDIVLDALVAISKTTGEAQAIGSLGFDANCGAGLAFDYATDALYFSSLTSCAAGSDTLWSIDTTTGLASVVSPIPGIDGAAAQYDALAIAHPAGNVCTDPASVPWLSLGASSGSLEPGDPAAPLTIAFDASGLADGTYSANLCFYSNDPLHHHQSLPVTLAVGAAADRIFTDGFDGP